MSTAPISVDPALDLKRDLGLVAWQIRYEQRAYWRNRGRGIFTFAFPLMFLVIFASLDKGRASRAAAVTFHTTTSSCPESSPTA